MGSTGHRKGEEADALAELSRALREGRLPLTQPKASAAVAAPAPPAATTAQQQQQQAEPKPKAKEKKDKKEKKETRSKADKKDKKRKHKEAAQRDVAAEAVEQPSTALAGSDGGKPAALDAAVDRLEQAAAVLHSAAAAGAAAGMPAALAQPLAAVAASAAELHAALSAAGYEQPAALSLLRRQAGQLHAILGGQGTTWGVAALQLPGLSLQGRAAAAAARQRLASGGPCKAGAGGAARRVDGEGEGAPLSPDEQQAFRQWYLPTFADCFSAEVEALQDADPPIPAGVLLQCVRRAADSGALFPPPLKRIVLATSTAVQGGNVA